MTQCNQEKEFSRFPKRGEARELGAPETKGGHKNSLEGSTLEIEKGNRGAE